MGSDFTGLLALLWIHWKGWVGGGQGRFLSRETRYDSCMELDWKGKEKNQKPPAIVPGGDTLSHPRGRWWGVMGFQTQPKGLTHRNADGLDAGCEGKELDNS